MNFQKMSFATFLDELLRKKGKNKKIIKKKSKNQKF